MLEIWAVIKAFGIWRRVGQTVGSGLGWATRSVTHILIIALAGVLAWGAYERHDAHKWHKIADQRDADLKAIPGAQAKALAAQVALNAGVAAKSVSDAKDSDDDPQTEIRAAVARYAIAHRLRTGSACSGAGQPVSATQNDAAAVDNGPGAGAIVLSQADYDILNDNTERLLKAHDYAAKAIADGIAMPDQATPTDAGSALSQTDQ